MLTNSIQPKRLIVNGDDFGMAAGVNRAIIEAHREGVLTSATMMANGRAFDEAVTLARAYPGLRVGCHVVLVDGVPLSPPAEIPTLLDRDGQYLRKSFRAFALAAISGSLDSDEIEREATAQIQRLQAAGIEVSHIDTHKHAHMFPAVFRPVLRAARNCGVLAVRNPFEPSLIGVRGVIQHPALWKRYSVVRALRVFAAGFRREVEANGMTTTRGTVGISNTGSMGQSSMEALISQLPPGTWELICHPAYADAEVRALTRIYRTGEQELRSLVSASTRKCIRSNGVELIAYRELNSIADA